MKIVTPLILSSALALSASAEVNLELLENPAQLAVADQTWTVQADGSSIAVTGGRDYDTAVEGLSGSGLGNGATGSFSYTMSSVYNFDPTDFTRTVSTGDGVGGTNPWAFAGGQDVMGPVTSVDGTINLLSSEAVVFTFDLTNLNLSPGTSLQVNSFLIRNNANRDGLGDLRVSHNDGFTVTQLTGTDPGQITVASANEDIGVVQSISQVVVDGDELAIWNADVFGGQYRYMGVEFAVIPETSSYALTGGVLALMAVIVRRRRMR